MPHAPAPLIALLLLAAAPPAVAQTPLELKVAVPRVRGNTAWGSEIMRRALLEALAAEVRVVDAAQYDAAEKTSTGGRGQPTRVSNEGMALVGRQVGAAYVLSVEILKTGYLYTAQARLVNTSNGEYQMDFKSGYYRPQVEAEDRAQRIARTTTAKIRTLLAAATTAATTATSSASAGATTDAPAPTSVASAGASSASSHDNTPSGNDDEIFGDSGGDSGATNAFEADMFAEGGLEGPGGVEETERRLEDLESKVLAGGRLFLRLNYFIADEDVFDKSRLNSPNIFDLYVDARVNDRVRGYAQVRIFHDFTLVDGAPDAFGTEVSETQFLFDQLWLKFDVGRVVYVTLGRQRVKWGVGRFWNPTDFLNTEVRDPLAVFDERLGVSLVRLHLPLETLGWNLYAVATFDDTDLLKRIGGALRAEILLDTTEITLSAAVRKDGPLRLGMDVSSGLGPFDLRAEGALTHQTQRVYYEGTFDPAAGAVPREVDRSDEWIPQGLLGLELALKYSDTDSAYIGVEYYYNGRGYRDSSLYGYMLIQDVARSRSCSGLDCPQAAFQALNMGRHYGAAYISLPKPGDWEDSAFIGTFLGNFDDGSMTGRVDYQLAILSFLSMSAFGQVHFGSRGEFKFGLDIPPVPGVMGLANGLSLADPIVDFGLGFSISF